MKKYLFLICAIAAFSIGCSSDIDDSTSTGSLTGIVADKTTGAPVSTVRLVLTPGGMSAVTGSDGSFSFPDLKSGNYTLVLSKEGYKPAESNVVIENDHQTELHLLIDRIPAIVTTDREVLDFGDKTEGSALSFSIVNSSYIDLQWEAQWDCTWISEVNPDRGTLRYGKTATIVVVIDREKLSAGENSSTIVIRSLNGSGSSEVTVQAEGELRESPVLNMLEVSEVSKSSATFCAEIVQPGTPAYTERGFVYAKQKEPTLENCNKISAAIDDANMFKVDVTGLDEGSKYYVRAYAINKHGCSYSANEHSFITTGDQTGVKTLGTSDLDIIVGEVTLNGEITSLGMPVYTERGFCVSTTGEPTMDDKIFVNGTGIGCFSYNMKNLQSQATYYVKAYALQNKTAVFGETIKFQTTQNPVELSTSEVTNIGSSFATLNATIDYVGDPAYTERGFCWGTSENPDIYDNRKRVDINNSASYSYELQDLDYDKTYYVRAYAIQNNSPVYGNCVSFNTIFTKASVNTLAATNVGYTEARLNGNVSAVGDPKITEKGFCYGTSVNPTIYNNKVDRAGVVSGKYSIDISDLQEGITYHFRAYVIQDGTPIYGPDLSFTTNTMPEVQTVRVSSLTPEYVGGIVLSWDATFVGYISNAGNPAYTERGFVYDIYQNPTVGTGTVVRASGKGTGTFSVSASNIKGSRYYYVRAYVKTSAGYIYGENIAFDTFE